MNITQDFFDISKAIALASADSSNQDDKNNLLQTKHLSLHDSGRSTTPCMLQASDLLKQIKSFEDLVNSAYDDYVDYHKYVFHNFFV